MDLEIYMQVMNMKRELDSQKSIDDYSRWNFMISFNELSNRIQLDFDNDLPIISVGSGSGKFESYHICTKGKDIMCIDPEPKSYDKEEQIYVEPKYPIVSNLIENEPDIVGECNLLLIWVTPSIDYDMDAIKSLKPKKMVVLFDGSGGAGSSKFHNYNSRDCDGEYTFNSDDDILYAHKMFSMLNDMNYYHVRTYTRV